ncbi:hypothetical protein EVU94_00830 [Flavobacteriaceae bacterium 144Ye]|nr:hypothetical protein EVU94_00830 [Flavobacteriaceae bacterium 144Ye]
MAHHEIETSLKLMINSFLPELEKNISIHSNKDTFWFHTKLPLKHPNFLRFFKEVLMLQEVLEDFQQIGVLKILMSSDDNSKKVFLIKDMLEFNKKNNDNKTDLRLYIEKQIDEILPLIKYEIGTVHYNHRNTVEFTSNLPTTDDLMKQFFNKVIMQTRTLELFKILNVKFVDIEATDKFETYSLDELNYIKSLKK